MDLAREAEAYLYTKRSMNKRIGNNPADDYNVYLMNKQCYAHRHTGDLFLQAMVPFSVRSGTDRKSSFSRDGMDPAYGTNIFPPRTPAPLEMTRPCIVYFHGTGFSGLDTYPGIVTFSDIVRKGIVFISCGYRGAVLDDARFPDNIVDAKEAIRYVRKNAAQFGIDEQKIFVMGSSSGGYNALMAALSREEDFIDGENTDVSTAVAGVIDCFGPVDFISEVEDRKAIGKNVGEIVEEGYSLFRNDPVGNIQLLQQASVLNQIEKGRKYPRICLVHGDNDRTVPYHQTERLYDKLMEAGADVQFITVEGGGHERQFWTTELVENIVDFIIMK